VRNLFLKGTKGMLLEGLDSKQTKQIVIHLCKVMYSKNKEERWESWCRLREYVTKDFCYRGSWNRTLPMAHLASIKNDAKLLQDLRDRQFPLDIKDEFGYSPIERARGIEVFSLLLRFAMEDAGLGEFFVPLDGPNAEEWPLEIRKKVAELIFLKILHTNIEAECFMLLLKNLFGPVYVKTKVFRKGSMNYDVKAEKNKKLRPRSKCDWDRFLTIERRKAPAFRKIECVDIYLANVLGELYINKDETVEKRTKEEQDLCDELLQKIDFADEWRMSEALLRNLLAELYVPRNRECKGRTDEEQIRVERILSRTNEEGWHPLLINRANSYDLEPLLRNILGTEFRGKYKKPRSPEWKWEMISKEMLKQHHKKTTLSELCDLIEAAGLKVPVLVKKIPKNCRIREHAKPFIWRNKLLAVGIRNWKMPDEERPQSNESSEAGPSKRRLRENKLCTLL
jgi:hypothetical protein